MLIHLIQAFLITIIWVAIFAYFRITRFIWISVTALLLSSLTVLGYLSWLMLIIFWIAFIIVTAFACIPSLRIHLFTKPVFSFFRKAVPKMSSTEREALDAGDVWWEGALFTGNPSWKTLLSFPVSPLSTEEEQFLNQQVTQLCAMLNEWEITKEQNLPPHVWEYIKKERFWAMQIPKEYGGLGFSANAHSAVITKIASRSVTGAVSVMVPNSLGPAELLLYYGMQAQKEQHLPALAHCEEVPCFALTSPEAGSDAAAISDTGIVCKDYHAGKEIIGIRLNWDKRYITLAPIATMLALAFKLYDPDHLLGSQHNLGITVCLIPTSRQGVEIGKRHKPLHMGFMNGPIRGKDVFIPLEWIVGGPSMIGQGWRMLMECLSMGRGISLPAMSTASAMLAYRTSSAYAKVRHQFKLPLGEFEGIAELLARIGGYTYILEACRTMTANAVTAHIKPAVISAIAKYHMTEMSRQVINDAMDIHAGRGIQVGPRNYLAYAYISAPIGITVEGANILTRNMIIFGQGAMRCHPYVRAEINAAANLSPIQGLKDFDKLFVDHVGYALSNFFRTFVMGLTGAHLVFVPRAGKIARYYQQLTRMSAAFAFVSDMAMLCLGGKLKRKEALSARLGDVLSHLYLASSVIKYYHDNKYQTEDLPYVQWALQHHLYRIQLAFDSFFSNFPQRVIARLLRWLTFPLGRAYLPPSDKLGRVLAKHMMTASTLRDRLTKYCFMEEKEDDPIYRVEKAFIVSLKAQTAKEKLQLAIERGELSKQITYVQQLQLAEQSGLLSASEIESLFNVEKLRREAIMVDEF